MIHAAPKTKSKAKAKKPPSAPKAASHRSMSAAAATVVTVASAGDINTIGGFTYDLDPSLTFPGLVDSYQIPQAASLPAAVAPLPTQPKGAPSNPTSNLLTEVLQSGGKFDPTQFDFSVLTLPNTHKANRKKKAGEGEGDKAAVAGNKNSSIL